MCLIIAQPSGLSPVPDKYLRTAWERNKDGAGIMYCEGGRLIIEKRFGKLKVLIAAYQAIHRRVGAVSPIVVHFRFATHGTIGAENCHPFALSGGDVGLAHNGILAYEPVWNSDESDTAQFCRVVLGNRSADDLMSDTMRVWLADIIGTGNKFVLLDRNARMSIVNESFGLWDDGVWYSNTGYRQFEADSFMREWYSRDAVSIEAWREEDHGGMPLDEYLQRELDVANAIECPSPQWRKKGMGA